MTTRRALFSNKNSNLTDITKLVNIEILISILTNYFWINYNNI